MGILGKIFFGSIIIAGYGYLTGLRPVMDITPESVSGLQIMSLMGGSGGFGIGDGYFFSDEVFLVQVDKIYYGFGFVAEPVLKIPVLRSTYIVIGLFLAVLFVA